MTGTSGKYQVTTYRNADPITDIESFVNGAKQAMRGGRTVCLSDRPADDWWFGLDDSHLDVGPFASERAARREAVKMIRLDNRTAVIEFKRRGTTVTPLPPSGNA